MKTIIVAILLVGVMAFALWARAPETATRQSCAVLSTACIYTPAEFAHIITDYHGVVSDELPASEYVSLYKNSDDQEPIIRFEARTDSLSRKELAGDFTCAPRGRDELLCHRPAQNSAIAETAILRPRAILSQQACDPPYDVLYLIPRSAPAGVRLEDYADLRQRETAPPRYARWRAALERRKCG